MLLRPSKRERRGLNAFTRSAAESDESHSDTRRTGKARADRLDLIAVVLILRSTRRPDDIFRRCHNPLYIVQKALLEGQIKRLYVCSDLFG